MKITPNVYLIGYQNGKVLARCPTDARFNGGFEHEEAHSVWPYDHQQAHAVWADAVYKQHCQEPMIPLKVPRNYVTLQVIKGGLT